MVSDTAGHAESDQSRLQSWSDTTGKPIFFLGLILVALSLISGLATYLILTGLTPIVPTHSVVVTVLLINAVLALGMISLIAWQVTGLWIARRRQAAGARLHVRIVSLFSIIAVLPAILLAVFASLSLDRGLDHWFSKRTKSIIKNSVNVATAYLNEHGQVIRTDVISMAADLDAAVKVLEARRADLDFGDIISDADVTKVSVIGVGMRSHAGVAGRMFATLAEKGINIQVISTSEIKVSVLIAEEYTELALRALHTAYELDAD